MRFTVPQFIEHEAKIVGPLTFRQFIFVGSGGGIVFFLYFYMGTENFGLFALISIGTMLLALALAFVKIGGRPLLTIFSHLLIYLISPKIFLWKKKEELPLKITEKSQLKKLSTQIETKTK